MSADPNFSVDRVVVSSNEHWLYLDFWPLIAYAYRTLWLHVRPTLVFLTERFESDPFVVALRRHGDVVLVRPVHGIPQAAQCKLARYWYAASRPPEEVVYIDDIDQIPIDREWHEERVQKRKSGTMLLVGAEVYGGDEKGQTPASMMTAEALVYRDLFNPQDLLFPDFLRSLADRGGRHRDVYSRVNHEGMESTTDAERLPGRSLFSDEALIVRLREERPVPVTHAERGYEPGKDTIDRSFMGSFDSKKLIDGGYVAAHAPRPYLEHRAVVDSILDYIRRFYKGGSIPEVPRATAGADPDMRFNATGISRAAFEWICATIEPGSSILEFGSGHVSTNYLSRYYWMCSIEHDLAYVNIYPSHYIYAPPFDGWYDLDMLRFGLDHRRLRGRKFSLTIVDGPTDVGMMQFASTVGSLRFDLSAPILVSGRKVGGTVVALEMETGRVAQIYDGFAVV